MKRAFICYSPFQLFNILNLVVNSTEENNDLYLVDKCNGSDKLIERLREQQWFKHIFTVNDDLRKQEDTTIMWYIKLMYYNLMPKRTILRNLHDKKFENKYKNYDEIYASVGDHFVACMLKKNPKAKFIMFEDGYGSYSGNILNSKVGWKFMMFSKIFHCGSCVLKPNKLLINNVKMCKSTMTKNIESLPAINKSTLDKIDKIFGNAQINYNGNKPIVWLTQPNEGFLERDEISHRIAKILLEQNLNIIVRLHPREKEAQLYKEYEIDKGNIMWELYVATADIENKILISSYSSAVFTPKILFDKEPILIFLFNLYDDDLTNKQKNNINQMISDLKNEYVHKERIIVAKDFNSLEKVVLDALNLIKK